MPANNDLVALARLPSLDAVADCQPTLSERHPEQFASFGQTLHGRKRQYISTTPETMFTPTPIPGTALYVETNMSSGNILQLVNTLLEGLGYPTDLLAIHLH